MACASISDIEAALRAKGLHGAVASDDTLIAIATTDACQPDAVAASLGEQYGVPSTVFDIRHFAELPALVSGKPDYPTILRLAKERRAIAGPKTATPPGKTIELAFARTFPNVPIRATDSFVSLGGDSLSYVTLSLDLERELGVLPELWEQQSLAALQELAMVAPKQPAWWNLRPIESEMVVRALAIMAVVVTHASNWVVGGGAEVLLLLSGYRLAHYQSAALIEGKGPSLLWSFIKRIMLPYYLILILYLIVKRQFDLPSLLLISNFTGRFGSLLEPYWFLEALLQCDALLVALFLFGPVRSVAGRNPWAFGLVLLAVSIAAKAAIFSGLHHERLLNRTPDAVFYLMALGWCIQQATTNARRIWLTAIVIGLAALDMFGPAAAWFQFPFPSNLTHATWLAGAVVLILWAPRLLLPGIVRAAVATVAVASFYIYLTHGVPDLSHPRRAGSHPHL
jgi:acyl carrier protein